MTDPQLDDPWPPTTATLSGSSPSPHRRGVAGGRGAVSRVIVIAAALLAMFAAIACGKTGPNFPKVVELGGCDICPTIISSGLAVGDNRVSMTIADKDGNHILDAQMHVAYYNLNDNKTKFRDETEARFIPVQLSYVDEQAGGETSPAGTDGVYVSYVNFDKPGDWGVEITITRDGKQLKPYPFRFNVRDASLEPAIGDPAPPSRQQVLANAGSIEEIDSSSPPRVAMHRMTIADALTSGKPAVVAFATPAFCRTRTCGPVMDTVIDPLAAKYGDRVNFIHIEPYVLADLRQANMQNPVPAAREWRLQSEPWVFVIGRDGKIAGKFEGIMAADEVDSVLALTLDATAAATPAP